MGESPELKLLRAIFGRPARGSSPPRSRGRGMIKVQRSNSSLCARCKHSTVVEGESVEIVHCHSFGKRMSFKVVNCSSFLEKNQPDEYRMREIAWILRTDPLRRKVGFAAPGSVAHRKLKHETPFPGDDGM